MTMIMTTKKKLNTAYHNIMTSALQQGENSSRIRNLLIELNVCNNLLEKSGLQIAIAPRLLRDALTCAQQPSITQTILELFNQIKKKPEYFFGRRATTGKVFQSKRLDSIALWYFVTVKETFDIKKHILAERQKLKPHTCTYQLTISESNINLFQSKLVSFNELYIQAKNTAALIHSLSIACSHNTHWAFFPRITENKKTTYLSLPDFLRNRILSYLDINTEESDERVSQHPTYSMSRSLFFAVIGQKLSRHFVKDQYASYITTLRQEKSNAVSSAAAPSAERQRQTTIHHHCIAHPYYP